jgi:hypothetical protein
MTSLIIDLSKASTFLKGPSQETGLQDRRIDHEEIAAEADRLAADVSEALANHGGVRIG